ncbi:MAG: hypothetical protein RR394_09300, partial [Oscillospiraceae bacterium]
DTSAKVSELSETHPALGVAYNVTGSFASPLALAGTAGHVAGDAIRGKETPLDTNTTMFSGTHMVNDSAEGIKRKTSTPLGDFLVDTGLSIAQFASKLPLGPAALPMMASGAGGQAALDVSERGGTAQQALKMGLVSAAAEYFTEKISLDRLLKIYKAGGAGFKDTLKTTAKNLGRQSVTEASEELLSEYINNVGDELIMKEQSQMSAYVNELVAGGMDAADALRKASVQFWVVNPLLAGAGGALSGGVMGAGGTVAGNVRQAGADSRLGTELRSSWGSDYDSAVAELVETGHEYMPETGSGYYADKAGEKLANGKQLTNREVGQLYRANLAAQEAEAEAYFTGRDPVNPIRRNDPLHPPGENEMQEFAIKRRQYEYGLQLANTLREYGVKNVVIEEMPDGENGRWENGTVYVSSRLDTAQAINAKVAHEISHAAQEGDAAFSGDVVLAMRDAGWDVDGAINAKRSTYTEFFEKQGKSKQWIADTVTEDYAADEVTADFIGELMRDGSLAQRLNTKPTLVHRIIDTVNRLLGGRVSTTERAAYTKLSQRLRTVAGVMGKGMSTNEYGASEEARFSIKNTRLMPWEQQVQEYFGESGALKSSDSMYLGETEAFLVNDGVPVAPLYIPTAVINKATREQKGSKSGHGLTQGQILKLKNGIESAPAIIHNPARNALIYLTENKDSEGRYIVATFDLSNNLYGERAHKATSIHGREAIDNLLYALDGSAKVFVKSKNKLDTIAGVQTDKSPKLLANVEFVNNNVPQAGTDVNGDKRYSVDESVDNNSKIASDIDVMELPAKARNYLHRSENGLSRQIAKLLDVPSPAGRSFLKPIVQKISQEYMNSGELSDDTVSSLFETAWDEGIAVSDEFYNEYKDLKDDLRTVAVTISEKDSGDIADYGAWLKHQFGRLKIFKTGGTPVDVRYMELSENYPDLFPEGITHPADQLRQMSEVA